MTSSQLKESPQTLEERVAILEAELAELQETLVNSPQKTEPWWVKIAGSSEHDPTFDEAVRLGQEWRKSAE
jgi:hypothetical protein